MATADRLRGRVLTGHTIPYGTLAGASLELKIAYYQFGYLHDKDMPELPVYEPPAVEVDLEETVLQAERARILGDILDGLTPRESKILRLRYGIGTYADYTLDEVGQMFDVTRERIRQIEAKAMRKLKHPMRREMFRYLLASFASW